MSAAKGVGHALAQLVCCGRRREQRSDGDDIEAAVVAGEAAVSAAASCAELDPALVEAYTTEVEMDDVAVSVPALVVLAVTVA